VKHAQQLLIFHQMTPDITGRAYHSLPQSLSQDSCKNNGKIKKFITQSTVKSQPLKISL